MQWPEGQYALLKPDTGCPGDVPEMWKDGYRKHYGAGSNTFSSSLSLAGNYTSAFMSHDFCVHGLVSDASLLPRYKTYWEKGSYCILRSGGKCPRGTPEIVAHVGEKYLKYKKELFVKVYDIINT